MGKEQENYDDGLTPQSRMVALRAVFDAADTSGDKLISMDEWCKACEKKEGKNYDEKKAKADFKAIDMSNSGDISLAELDLFVLTKQIEATVAKFKAADKSGDRTLDKKGFHKFFSEEGMKKKAIDKLWKKCNANGDKNVSFVEFKTFMERELADGVLAKTFGDLGEAAAKAGEARDAKKAKKK